MKKVLIIYPHWPPSNLAGVHRSRLIGNFLHEFDWETTILTVSAKYYEEKPDIDMVKIVSHKINVFFTKAFKITKPRVIGDIGLRAFFQLYRKAKILIKENNYDFLWIPIPSFYTALLGRFLHRSSGIKYGIDYIDPWVRDLKDSVTIRERLSLMIAKILEPVAVKRASLISGVSEKYFSPVLERNFKNRKIITASMPYGFDPNDHKVVVENIKTPWYDFLNSYPLIYAGAFLPKSNYFTEIFFKTIAPIGNEPNLPAAAKTFFGGTGNYPHNSISAYA